MSGSYECVFEEFDYHYLTGPISALYRNVGVRLSRDPKRLASELVVTA
jgi:hypothetical protein